MTRSRLQPFLRLYGGWIALAAAVAIWTLLLAVHHQPFHVGQRRLCWFDLSIYVDGARRIVHGVSLYAHSMRDGRGFTYPPFAAMLFAPFAYLPFWAVAGGVTVLNLGLLVFTLRRAWLIPDRSTGRGGRSAASPDGRVAWSCAAAVAAVVLWLEPVALTLGYGQVNLLIAALVVFDLSRRDDARTKGVGIGLGAAIKLTPLLFIVFLAISGRRRASAVAVATFVASIGLAYVCGHGDATTFWSGLVLHSSRVGDPTQLANQSLRGLIARLGAGADLGRIWLLTSVGVAVIALGLAQRASRDGDEAAAFSLVAVATLLVSPISWTHHWALVVPALVLLARRVWTRRSPTLAIVAGVLVGLVAACPPDWVMGRRSFPGVSMLLAGNAYVLAGLGVVAVPAAVALARGWSHRAVALPGMRATSVAPARR